MLENISPEWLAAIAAAVGAGSGYAVKTVATAYKGVRTVTTDRREDKAIDASTAYYERTIAQLEVTITRLRDRTDRLEKALELSQHDKHAMHSRIAGGGMRVTDIMGSARDRGDE